MSLIKKIKQFINGSWQEFNLSSDTLNNVVTLDQEETITAVKTFTGSVNENSYTANGSTRIAGNRIDIGGPLLNGTYISNTELSIGGSGGVKYRSGSIFRETPGVLRPLWT